MLSSAQSVNGVSITGPAPWIDVTAYGAKADSQVTTNCTTSVATAFKILTCSSANFDVTDIGKSITLYDASGVTQLVTTIQAVQSPPTMLTLSTGLGSMATGLTARWSTDNYRPIQNAINAIKSSGSGTGIVGGATLYFPYGGTGNYYISTGLAVGVNPFTSSTNLVPGVKLVGECGALGDPGTPTGNASANCSTIITDQSIVMLTVGDTVSPTGPTLYHSGLLIQDLGFKDVSFPGATSAASTLVTGGIHLLNTNDFNLTNVRVQRITSGYGIQFDGSTSANGFTQFGVVINPSIAGTKFPIQTNNNTSEINFYGGNVGCEDLPGTSQISGSIGMDLGTTNFVTGVAAAGEWGIFGTHILNCATAVSTKNVSVLQWYGVAEQTFGTKVGSGFVLDSESGKGGGNVIGGSVNNFGTGIQLKGFSFDTIITGSITNNSVGMDLNSSNVTRTKVLGTLSTSNTTQLTNTSGASGPLSTAFLATNNDYAGSATGNVQIGSQVPTDLTFSTPKSKPATNPASGRRLYSDSGSSNDLTVIRPDGTTTDLETGTVLFFSCTGVFSSSATNMPFPSGGTTCNTVNVVELPLPFGGSLKSLRVKVGVTGSNVSSGATTVFVNGSATSITCTIGNTLTACNDPTHSVTVAAGDTLSVRVTTQASETLANMRVGLQLQ